MDAIDNERATALELVAYAQQVGINLDLFRNDSIFQRGKRWIILWRKVEGLPCSGRVDETEGTLHYNLQGAIELLPRAFKDSASAFKGVWHEAGTLNNINEALAVLKAWLLDGKEVDELPERHVKRCGI